MGFLDTQFSAIENAVSVCQSAAEQEIASLIAQAATDATTISGLTQQIAILTQQLSAAEAQIAADQAEEAAENAPSLTPLTTANKWEDQTPHSGSPQPTSHTPTISADQSAVSIALSGGPFAGTLYVRKYGPQPDVKNISYSMQRQSSANINAWESDIEYTKGGKKWNFSFQLRFDTGKVQIWHGGWVDTPIKHGVDPTKLTSVVLNLQVQPTGAFYKSVVINGTEMPIGVMMPLENTSWGDNFITQLQQELNGAGGSLQDTISQIGVGVS